MKKQTQIIDMRVHRTFKEVQVSIDGIKRKIVDLKLGTFRYSHATPNGIPDIDVVVRDQSVNAFFLCDSRVTEGLIRMLGSRALEYIESALIDTLGNMVDMKTSSEAITSDVLKKVSGVAKELLNNGKQVDTMANKKEDKVKEKGKVKSKFPKHKLKKNKAVPLYTPNDHDHLHMVRITVSVKNKNDKDSSVDITLFKKDSAGNAIKMDTITGAMKPLDKGTIQLVVPSDCHLLAKSPDNSILLQILTIQVESALNH